ncbi:DUF6624 domain-containing protein [Solitalea lacus]|uniref:DUF6624 domain-containing protein n=1 Tax=Solitalea lacus TaxID=2911172 RepID=UPI001ED9D711|nr:DUF6624 domain-containing protein [Solitalea lacus]UKJ07016.1 hypothetical protein L2B55_15990 [Solitalea lacus]
MLTAKIIAKIGLPTQEEYGEEEAMAAYLITWHADMEYRERYLPLFEAEAMKKTIPMMYYVTLKDRVLIANGEKQLYGTKSFYDTSTQKQKLFPIHDEEHVNERRKKLGLEPIKIGK